MPVPPKKPAAPTAKPTLVKPAAKAAPAEEPLAVASSNPDEMLQGGLMDDFDGLVVKARYVPWDYNGNLDHHVLGVALTIQPYNDDGEPEGDEFVQTYSAGDLEHFAPSMDGRTPVDLEAELPEGSTGEEYEGIYALRVGKKEQLNNNTNYAQFVQALLEAGFPKTNLTAACTYLEGVFGHWNRIPQKKRSGIVATADAAENGGRQRQKEILVVTEIKDAPAEAGGPAPAKAAPAKKVAPAAAKPGVKPAAKPAAKPAPVEEPTEEETAEGVEEEGTEDVEGTEDAAEVDPLDAKLYDIVVEAAAAAGENGLVKGKLPGAVIKKLAGPDKAKGVKRVGEVDFLESGGAGGEQWVYDADSGTILAV
jgi:hypothetical protein